MADQKPSDQQHHPHAEDPDWDAIDREGYCSVKEAAHQIGKSPKQILALKNRGKLICVQEDAGYGVSVSRWSLRQYTKEHRLNYEPRRKHLRDYDDSS